MVITFLAVFIDIVKGISVPFVSVSLRVIKLCILSFVISVSFKFLIAVLNPIVILLLAKTSVLLSAGIIVAIVSPVVVTVKVDDDKLVSLADASSTAEIDT
jgi:hypothetical protein